MTTISTPRVSRRNPRAAYLCSAAMLLLTPALRAQSDVPQPAPPPAGEMSKEAPPAQVPLYSMKFDGGDLAALEQRLEEGFPEGDVVIAPAARRSELTIAPFEIHDVRLEELGRTIEFLSDVPLTVEVMEKDTGPGGCIWRIGLKSSGSQAEVAKLKTISVAAPRLFADQARLDRLGKDAESMERIRLEGIIDSARPGTEDLSGVARTRLLPLPEQKIFVIVGTEDGIAGMESFIKAAEQLAAEDAARKQALAASLAPKLRAVVAPHLFADAGRLQRTIEEFDTVQAMWNESHEELMEMVVGSGYDRGGVCVQQRPEQKLFVLIGSDEDIAGMESLIQAAEKNAADEDARELQKRRAFEAKEAAIQRAKEKKPEEGAGKIDR